MATSFGISASRVTGEPSFEFGVQQPRRMESYSRGRDDGTTATSSEHITNDTHSSDRSLLPYAAPSPFLEDFPMPPKTLRILPHPHAPPAPTSGGLRPAIYRDPGSQYHNVSIPSGKTLTDTLAEAAVVGKQQIKDGSNTIHGQTSFDLLSATGPVPIRFALGRPTCPTTPSPTTDSTQERDPSNSLSRFNSPGNLSPARPWTEESDTARDRRSFSGIISAIETPSSFPIGRSPADTSVAKPPLNPLPNHPNSSLAEEKAVPMNEGSLTPSSTASFPDSINAASSNRRDVPTSSPNAPKKTPRKLSKSLPPSNYRARPILPLTLNHQNARGIAPKTAPSSVPPSPRTVTPPHLPNSRIHSAVSIPNLRSVPEVEPPHRHNLSNSKNSRNTRRGSSSSASTIDDAASYNVDILEGYGVELSRNSDSSRDPSHGDARTATQMFNYPTATISSDGSLSPRLPPEQAYSYSQQRSGSSASTAPQDTFSRPTTAATTPSPPRSLSLRHKISIPGMRNSATATRRRQDFAAVEREQAASRQRGAGRSSTEAVTVEVDDMEFTLVKPEILRNGSPIPLARDSEDGAVGASLSREIATQGNHVQNRPGNAAPRSSTSTTSQGQTLHAKGPWPVPDSPSSAPQTPLLSPLSGTFAPSVNSHASRPTSEVSRVGSRGSIMDVAIASANAENHRQLEGKWINAMSSVPSAEAGKSKKIRKLVIDGIPTSLRGVVWLYLTDNKGRRMPGVYDQLHRRKAEVSDTICTDVRTQFPDQSHLCEPEGPVVSVLQAYLSMVPDTVYNYSLALIVGNLLLQNHEEDSFWTFVALMDRHLRGYFSPTVKLLEIDSILFEKAVGTFDKALAARLFGVLRVNVSSFCGHWFTTLFTCALPPSFVPRIWDLIMYFSDPMFLFRLGLAVLRVCRPFIMDAARCRSAEDAITFLVKPPITAFPTHPDVIISSALGVKFKEDDLRKLRPKIEAQLKQRHPQRLMPSIR